MKKDKRENGQTHPVSESEPEDQAQEFATNRSASPTISQKQKKKKSARVSIPMYSMEDFSDLMEYNSKIEFPTDLKLRHPLFGIDFEKRVGLPVAGKKRKIKKEKGSQEVIVKQEIVSDPDDETPKMKKKKQKKKDVEDCETEMLTKKIKQEICSPSHSDNELKHKKKKSKKSLCLIVK